MKLFIASKAEKELSKLGRDTMQRIRAVLLEMVKYLDFV